MSNTIIYLILFHAGLIVGWLLRWQRDKKIFDAMKVEVDKIRKALNL